MYHHELIYFGLLSSILVLNLRGFSKVNCEYDGVGLWRPSRMTGGLEITRTMLPYSRMYSTSRFNISSRLKKTNARELRYTINRKGKSYGNQTVYWHSQINDEFAKKAEQALQNEKEMGRKKNILEIKSRKTENVERKVIDRQRDKLRDMKISKINTTGKHSIVWRIPVILDHQEEETKEGNARSNNQSGIVIKANAREQSHRTNRIERGHEKERILNVYRRSQVNKTFTKNTVQALQKQQESERKINIFLKQRSLASTSQIVQNEKQKELDRQRDELNDEKMVKTQAIGKQSHGLSTLPILIDLENVEQGGTKATYFTEANQALGREETELETLKPHTLFKQLTKLLAKAEFINVAVTSIDKTAEYNDVVLLKAADMEYYPRTYRGNYYKDNYVKYTPEKKIIFIVHGLTAMGFKDVPCLIRVRNFLQLLKSYFNHLNKFDIFIVPMANPDGVAYSYQVPFWNKNLSPQEACPGVALDRNFDVFWNGGKFVKSCSQQFPGEHSFTEPETSAIRKIFHQYAHKIAAYIHVHSGGFHEHIYKGDAVLFPRGYSDDQSHNDRYTDLKGEIEDMMKNASFKVMSMSMNTLYEWYGRVTGTSVDYASTVYGIPFALEFVMQIYGSNGNFDGSEDDLPNAAQTEIWHRTVNAIFKFVYRSVQNNTDIGARRLNSIRTTLPPHMGF